MKFNFKFDSSNLILSTDLLVKFISLLFFPIVANYLTPVDFGLINNYFLFISIISIFINVSHINYFQVEFFQCENKPSLKKNIVISISINFLFFSIISLFFLNRINQFFAINGIMIFLAFITGYFQIIFELIISLFRLTYNSRKFFIYSISNSIMGVLLILVLIYFNKFDGFSRIYSASFITIAVGIIALFSLVKDIKLFSSINLLELKEIYRFGFFLLPHNLGVWVKYGIEKLFISNRYGLEENGYYSFAFTLSSIFLLLFNMYISSISPKIYEQLSAITSDKFKIESKKIVKFLYTILIVYGLFLLLGYIFTEIVILKFFIKYTQSIKFLPYLIIYNFINAIYVVISMFVFYSKRVKYFGVFTFANTIIQIALVYYFNMKVGEMGILLASLISVSILVIFTFVYSLRVYKLPWFSFFK